MTNYNNIRQVKKNDKVRIFEEERPEGTHVVLQMNGTKYYWIQVAEELNEFLEDGRDVVEHDGHFYVSVPKHLIYG